MNKQGLDLDITHFRKLNFQIKARTEAKHNSFDFKFFIFFGTRKSI